MSAILNRQLVLPWLVCSGRSVLERTELMLSKLATIKKGHQMQTDKEPSRSEAQ